MLGKELGKTTCLIICIGLAPKDCAARILAWSTERTPVAVAITIGAKIAR